MTLVPINKLKSNPWRDFEFYPLDEEAITKLIASINDHGFWKGIVARKVDGGYEIGFGHHRVEAGKRFALREIDIEVEDISDDRMIRLMCQENATQRGAVAGAIINEVAAVTKRVAELLLNGEDLSPIGDRCPDLFESQKALDTARGTLERGDGVGEPLIRRYLHNARSQRQIKEAIAALKASGSYTQILREIEQATPVESDEPEESEDTTEAAAEETTTAPRTRRARARTARKHSERRNKRIFDKRCARVFDNENQFTAFREAVTTESGRRFIAVAKQLELAEKIKRELSQGGRRIGAPAIRSYVSSYIREAISAQRQIDQVEREQAMRENRQAALDAKIKDILIHLNAAANGAMKICELLSEDRELASSSSLIGRLETKIDMATSALQEIKRRIQLTRRRAA